MRRSKIRQAFVFTDTHAGCSHALCHPDGHARDDGGLYKPSPFQRKLWGLYEYLLADWLPRATRGEPYVVVHCGDALDGVHHRSVYQWTHNLETQVRAAEAVIRPALKGAEAYYHIRGTEAHVGQSAQDEERLARNLGAVPNEDGQHARWELRLRLGQALVHFAHHVSVTGSSRGETTGIHAELIEAFIQASRWGGESPDVVIRGHRHTWASTCIATSRGSAISATLPGWQAKTPFAFRIVGARQAQPQFGGVLIVADDDDVYIRHRVWTLEGSQVEGVFDGKPTTERIAEGADGRGVARGDAIVLPLSVSAGIHAERGGGGDEGAAGRGPKAHSGGSGRRKAPRRRERPDAAKRGQVSDARIRPGRGKRGKGRT